MGIGHGKLLLFGEHAVVHGHPAVGIGCTLYTSLCFEADASLPAAGAAGETEREAVPIEIAGRNLNVYGIPRSDRESLTAAISRGLTAVGRDGGIPDEATTIFVDSTVPRGVGLGSSAALCTAIADALYTPGSGAGPSGASRLEVLASLAHEIEHLYHGSPSGVDTALSVYGGIRAFSRGGSDAAADAGTRDDTAASGATPGPRSRPLLPAGESAATLLYGYVPRSGNTKALVGRISAALSRGERDAVRRIAELGRLSEAAIAEIDARKPDAVRLGSLASQAQEALSALELSTAETDRVLAAGRRAGARGGKLSGAGGGGAWFLLFDDAEGAERGRAAILEQRPDLPVFTMPLVPPDQT